MSVYETLGRVLFSVLIYPGLLFLAVTGFLAAGLARKFSLRSEGRAGADLLQPWRDFRKYFRRAAVVPGPAHGPEKPGEIELKMAESRAATLRALLYFLPGIACLGLLLGICLVYVPGSLWPFFEANGGQATGVDLVAVVLLLELPVITSVVVGSLGGSIYSQLAGSRVAQLALVYTLPYVVAVSGPALALQTLDTGKIAASTDPKISAVKLVCGLIFLVVLPARLRLRPLATQPGQGTEGVTAGLNGPPLAMFRLMEIFERAALATLFAALLVPYGGSNPAAFVGGLLLALGVTGVIETALGQNRLKETLRFYFIYLGGGATIWFLALVFLVKI